MDKRFDDMYNMFLFDLSSVLAGVAFLYNQNRKSLDGKQLASILMNTSPSERQKIKRELKEILEI